MRVIKISERKREREKGVSFPYLEGFAETQSELRGSPHSEQDAENLSQVSLDCDWLADKWTWYLNSAQFTNLIPKTLTFKNRQILGNI